MLFVVVLSFLPQSTEAKTVSYLKNPNYRYTYEYDNGTKLILEFWKKSGGYNNWTSVNLDAYGQGYGIGEKETLKGLYYNGDLVLPYPIIKGKKWKDPNNSNSTTSIRSTNKTIKTQAGTFKNVVEVRYTVKGFGYYTTYYAPNHGIILSTSNVETNDYETELHYKLIKLIKK